MAQKKVKFGEGDLFAVPLESGEYVVCLVARNTRVSPLGYFFGTVFKNVPRIDEVDISVLQPILIARFGVVGINRGEWPYIGHCNGWDRSQWPVPRFKKVDPLTNQAYAVEYDGDDFSTPVRSLVLPEEELNKLFPDGLFGYLAVADYVSMLLER